MDLGDETTKLFERIDVLVCLHTHVTISLLHPSCWSLVSSNILPKDITLVIGANLMAIIDSLSACDTALDNAAKEENF